MSLVYNNNKLIGKCESYSIDKVPGTSPFVMLTNYESLRSELNENQQVVFEQLCLIYDKQIYKSKMQAIYIFINEGMSEEFLMLDKKESDQVMQAFAGWGMEQEEDDDTEV